jgi:hypothetical protein
MHPRFRSRVRRSNVLEVPLVASNNQSFSRSQQPRYEISLQLPMDPTAAITHLAWSPYLPKLGPTDGLDYLGFLAVSARDGSVHLALISISSRSTSESEEPSRHVSVLNSRELVSKQRIPVSNFGWCRRDQDLLLAIARNGILTLSIHPFESLPDGASKVISSRHQNYSPVLGIPILTVF